MLEKFSHVMVYVKDLDRAVKWYGRHLRFVPDFVAPAHYAVLRNHDIGMRLDLHPLKPTDNLGEHGPMVFFVVPGDFHAALKRLKDDGVDVGEARSEGGSPLFATIKDSEGNAIGLCEKRGT